MKRRQSSRPASRAPKALSRLPQHAVLLSPIITSVFAELDLGAALHLDATKRTFEEWYTLHVGPNSMGFEIQYGTADARWRYNQQGWERAHEQGRPLLTSHAGMHDFFVKDVHISVDPPSAFQRAGDSAGIREELDVRLSDTSVEVVDWGSGPSELLTLQALRVLRAAGRSAADRR